MAVFKIQGNIVKAQLQESQKFRLEREMEDFFSNEDNLESLLGVKFISRQYPISNRIGIIDILGIDHDNSPVIIELKLNDGGNAVLTQGQAYYSWLLGNRRSFEDLVKSKLGSTTDVNWETPRLILIAKVFPPQVQMAVKQSDYVELITYSFFEPDIFQLEGERLPTMLLQEQSSGDKIRRQDEKYDFEQHLAIIKSEEVKSKILLLKEKILQLPHIKEDARQSGVAYKHGERGRKFMRLEFRPTWVQLLLKEASYVTDNRKIIIDITSNQWGYKGKIKFDEKSDPDYIFEIIQEAYQKRSGN